MPRHRSTTIARPRTAATTRVRAPAAFKGHLPCPFYRRRPGAHAACADCRFKRARDIKQHLTKHHLLPPHYCPTCNDSSFTDEAQCDSHIKEAGCVAPPEGVLPIDGLDQKQVALIGEHNSQRGQGETETWLQYYKILFPNEPRPISVLMGGRPEVEQVVGWIAEYWKAHGQTIVAAIVATHPPNIGNEVVESLLSGILSQIGTVDDHAAPGWDPDPASNPDPVLDPDPATPPAVFFPNMGDAPTVFFPGMGDAPDIAETDNSFGPHLEADNSFGHRLGADGSLSFAGLPSNADSQPLAGPTFNAGFTPDAAIDPRLLARDQTRSTPTLSHEADFLQPSVLHDNLDVAHLLGDEEYYS